MGRQRLHESMTCKSPEGERRTTEDRYIDRSPVPALRSPSQDFRSLRRTDRRLQEVREKDRCSGLYFRAEVSFRSRRSATIDYRPIQMCFCLIVQVSIDAKWPVTGVAYVLRKILEVNGSSSDLLRACTLTSPQLSTEHTDEFTGNFG